MRRALFTLALAGGLGCAKPNMEVLHILRPMEPASATPPLPRSSLALEIMPVRLPESLQRPQLVIEISPGALKLLEAQRWGNGLDKDLQRVLNENLTLLTGSQAVVPFPYGERAKATHRLEVDVHRLDGAPGGTLTLQATWMVTRPQGGPALLLRRTTLQRPIQGPDAEAIVAAHNLILGDLSQVIAVELKGLGSD